MTARPFCEISGEAWEHLWNLTTALAEAHMVFVAVGVLIGMAAWQAVSLAAGMLADAGIAYVHRRYPGRFRAVTRAYAERAQWP